MIKKIDHVAIIVGDIDEALKIYSELFGFKVIEEVTDPDGEFKSVLVSVGDITLEFLQPLKPTNSFAKFLEKRGAGLHHISFATDGIDEELKLLKAKGVRLMNEKPESLPLAKIAFVHPQATEGILIELVQKVPLKHLPHQLSQGSVL